MDTILPFHTDLLDHNNEPDPAVEKYNPLKDRVYITGLVLLAISLGLFFWSPTRTGGGTLMDFFLLNYVFVWLYMVILWSAGRLRWWMFGARRVDYPVMLLLLLLWMVSCFALNREIDIFRPSAAWLNWHIGISGLACIAFAWQDRMGMYARRVLWFVLGATAVLFAYYSIALLPLSAMGLVAFWFFGLTFHAIIPLVFTIYLVLILRNAIREDNGMRWPAFAGVAAPLLAVVLFAGTWYKLSSQLSAHTLDYETTPQNLPKWVVVSQHLESNSLYGYVLKAVAEGRMPSQNRFGGDLWLFGNSVSENDPLMQIAAAVSPNPQLNDNECKKIYAAQYDHRNVMEERLWAGDDLVTTRVESRILLDPGHRLSYTEKLLTVAQTNFNNSERTQTQEAIYTFFLPEGGAVTALSLWINGKEEPGVLTAKSKAQEAYNTIVGREQRDPAVVFWQEGNQVRVRVFPVTREMPRRFKVGITAPLRYDERTLEYQNISFDGPSALTASEQDSVYFEGNGKFTEVPVHFENGNGGTSLLFEGRYRHNWSLRCEAPPLAASSFSFDGKAYFVSPWNKQSESFQPRHIYLDLNEAWTQTELTKMRALIGRYPVSAATAGELVLLTQENVAGVFQQSRSLRFSLFPFYKIDDPENSLVITKSAAPTPLPSELENSDFSRYLNDWHPALLRVFHLGDDAGMTAYLRALQERRDVFCTSGSSDLLDKYLTTNTFPQNPEGMYTVAIPSSGLLITEKDSITPGKAPDHLFRLFAYNKIMKELGNNATSEPEELVRLAEQAYVVTPVSSLVTLETKQDYERFNIKPTEGLHSLGNAGSVPEPHEWALIVLLTLGAFLAWRGRI
ncbi:MAG TPA: XrtN system VIT domain-containing protein [Saprospiraceae bacterium]|mgnify:CR=1 FL=1|nr:XrtN system VIT domain-containing protein [Saprospiraceae bacterium]HPI05910.1 XrtN system VIT domain-containing protein [Saprospiraceae bacterium]